MEPDNLKLRTSFRSGWWGTAVLCSPLLLWAILDNSIWSWDQSWYGKESLASYLLLIESPAKWLHNTFTVFGTRAPMIVWLGQFFVPVGVALGKVEAGLLLLCCLFSFLSLYYLYILSSLLQKSNAAALAAVTFTASAPLFMGMAQQFFVESIQMFSVCYFYYLAYRSKSLHPLNTALGLLFAIAIAIGAKASSPIYVLFPGCIILMNLLSGLRRLDELHKPDKTFWWIVAAPALFLMVSGWYLVNWDKLIPYLRSTSSGYISSHYGSEKTVLSSLGFWMDRLRESLFTNWTAWFIAVLLVSAVMVTGLSICKKRISMSLRDPFNRVFLSAVLQVMLVIGVFIFQINEEPRYLLPLLPSLAICILWIMSRAQSPVISYGASIVFLSQWIFLHAASFGFIGKPESVSHWLTPVELSSAAKDELVWMDDFLHHRELDGKYVFSLVDIKDFNHSSLTFISHKARFCRDTYLVYSLPVWAGRDWNKAAEIITSESVKAPFVLTLEEKFLPPQTDPFNMTARDLSDWLKSNPDYSEVYFPNSRGIVIYQNTKFYPKKKIHP